MHILISSLVYYLAGSAIAGFIMGAGFATNLRGRPNDREVKSLQSIGTYIPLHFEGLDGGLIAHAEQRRPTIIYVHGRSANRMEMAPLARAMFKQGYNAVLWDSKSRRISYGPKEIEQVRKIVAFVRNDPHVLTNEIYIVGFSLGGAIAIGAAAVDTEHHIRGIVADSPYADLRNSASRYVTAFGAIPKVVAWPAQTIAFATARSLHEIEFESRNPADWAVRVSCPVLLIHGKSDKRIPHTNSEQILERLHTDKELWLVEGAGHTRAFSKFSAEYVRRVREFLNAIGASGSRTPTEFQR
jgi:dipeptidyl aminopeptidase/acylaminoacyl peptidase